MRMFYFFYHHFVYIFVNNKTNVKQFNSMKIRKPIKVKFQPSTEEEKRHLEELNNLLDYKRSGDWQLVADKIGISAQNSVNAYMRIYSKHHFEAVAALSEIVNNRKHQLNASYKKTTPLLLS